MVTFSSSSSVRWGGTRLSYSIFAFMFNTAKAGPGRPLWRNRYGSWSLSFNHVQVTSNGC